MEHTQGKMTAGGNVMDDCIKIGDELIGVIYPCESERKDEALANAKRLAACWNACEGFETEGLETMLSINDSLIAMRDRLQVRELELHVQRDALLAALEVLVLFSKPTKTNAVALNNAHQAIAIAKGGAVTIKDLQRLSNERQVTPECAARIVEARKVEGGAQ